MISIAKKICLLSLLLLLFFSACSNKQASEYVQQIPDYGTNQDESSANIDNLPVNTEKDGDSTAMEVTESNFDVESESLKMEDGVNGEVKKEEVIEADTELSNKHLYTDPIFPVSFEAADDFISWDYAATYELLCGELSLLSQRYPEIVEIGSIGFSAMDKNLLIVKLGTGEREILMVGGMHSCEHITVDYLIHCIEDYAEAFYANTESSSFRDYDIVTLLSEFTVYVIPSCNPDGLDACVLGSPLLYGGYYERAELKANANGVNLNRNFPFYWEEDTMTSAEPHYMRYRGVDVASEPETQALIALCQAHDFECAISFHTEGKVIYWHDDENGDIPGDKALASTVAESMGYSLAESSSVLATYAGGFENWFRQEFNRPGFCIEMIKAKTNIYPTSTYNSKAKSLLNYDTTKYAILSVMQYLLSNPVENECQSN